MSLSSFESNFYTTDEFQKDPYLTKQIIAYLGNKRKLLPLLTKALEHCLNHQKKTQFIDFFAGSGIVSRLAKKMGFLEIISNDWEDYSYYLNKGFLEVNQKDFDVLFQEKNGIESVLDTLNHLTSKDIKEPYISRYYAPTIDDIHKVDYIKERLFYTKANAIKIDAIRDKIEEWYPSHQTLSQKEMKEKSLLMALLLYQAATHTNTSGVFKAYHKGFGGFGADALGRILKEINLLYPILCESLSKVKVYKEDVLSLATKIEYDSENGVVYLDPPYNGHQYGSNYHLLNTISLWDKIPVSNERKKDGSLKYKAGIRQDWKQTRSLFCYKETATKTFQTLLESIKSRTILLSYSSDGIIPFEEICNMAYEKGQVTLITNEYVKYRGGRQSSLRLNKNIEFVLIIDTKLKNTAKNKQVIEMTLERKKLALMFTKSYNKQKLQKYFNLNASNHSLTSEFLDVPVTLNTKYFFRLTNEMQEEHLSLFNIQKLYQILNECINTEKKEELHTLTERLEFLEKEDKKEMIFLLKEYLKSLKHLAYTKNEQDFRKYFTLFKGYKNKFPEIYVLFEKKGEQLLEIFNLRLKNKKT